ncbi:MAG TPA: TIM barrel protein [Anaerolineales bacterium]|nr:TIM barrel protein [Anaerolineales bacterium]
MNVQARIKLGVTLYSLQDEYVWGKLSLEGCLAALQQIGAEGVELLGDQMIKNSPFPEASFYQDWQGWLLKYRLTPVCDDIFINTTLYKNRRLTKKEAIAALKAEIVHAHKMGFKIVRLVSMTPNEIILPCLSFAEDHDVQMALEIHAGSSGIEAPSSREFIEIMTQANSPYIGLVFDMGLFCRKYPRVIREYYRREGVTPALLDFIDHVFASGEDLRSQKDKSKLEAYLKSPIDEEYWEYVYHFENNPLDIMLPYLSYVRNSHGKFYEMTDEGIEYSIPYDQIIALLKVHGYDGFICSEYEGNRFVPSGVEVQGVDQLARHHKMLRKLIQGV